MNADVVVVGAGIGGAVLALSLGRRGWTVALLERERQPLVIPRPEILWGATPAALDGLGVGEAIRTECSVQLGGVDFRQGLRRRLAISRRDLDRASVEPFSTDPGLTRAAIADAALATGNVTVLRGVEVTGVLREEQRIVGVSGRCNGQPIDYRARLVVGDDGVHSVVRQGIVGDIELGLFPLDFVTAAIRWPDELPPDRVRAFLKPAANWRGIPAMGCMPWPGRRGVVLMPMSHERVIALFQGSPEQFWNDLGELTPLAEELRAQLDFPGDFRQVRRPYGHAPKYVADGAAIIGDAAHPMSPAGGQGANASIWDALSLAEVAHEALMADDVSGQRLDHYERLRRPRNRASVAITERAVLGFTWLRQSAGITRLALTALTMLDSLPAVKAWGLSTIATTFVTR